MFSPFVRTGRLETDAPALVAALESLLIGERTADMANAAALLSWHLEDVNWVGFYRARRGSEGDELVLGPFQGLPACVVIPFGKGVCGTAAAERRTVVVPDVAAFPGHIACDAASRSEIVVPLVSKGRVIAVLDVDSPRLNRFGNAERRLLEDAAAVLVAADGT